MDWGLVVMFKGLGKRQENIVVLTAIERQMFVGHKSISFWELKASLHKRGKLKLNSN